VKRSPARVDQCTQHKDQPHRRRQANTNKWIKLS